MAVSPYTTANEIENYQGNAALGYGGGAVDYNTNPNDANPLAGIDSTLARIQAEDAQQRALRHQEKRQDQERMMEMLNSVGGSAFNVAHPGTGKDMSMQPISEDDAILQKKADEQRQFILKNPENYGHRPEFYQKKQELDHLSRAAQERAIFRTSEMLRASKEWDKDKRDKIIANMNKQLSENPVDNFKALVPHPEFSKASDMMAAKDYRDVKNRQTTNTRIENRNGQEYTVTTTAVPINEILAPQFDPALLEQSQQNIDVFKNSPMGQNPAYINQMNAALVRNAKTYGIPENEIPWLAVVGQDGKIIYNPNPGQGQAALNLEHYGRPWEEATPTDVKQKAAEAKSRIVQAAHAMKIADAKLKIDQSKEAREAAEDAKGNYLVEAAVESIQKHTADLQKRKKEPATQLISRYFPGTKGLGISIPVLNENSIDPTKYQASVVPVDENISHILGEAKQGPDGKQVTGYKKAKNAIFLTPNDGNIREGMYLMEYDYTKVPRDSNGKPMTPKSESTWKVIPYSEFVGNKIHSLNNNDKPTEKLLDHIGEATLRLNGMSPEQAKEKVTTQKESQPEATKTIGGKTYVKKDGQWFEQ